ncbi:RNA polymerase sigma-70 factor (ECF subfamily) [Catenuloplanes nepalensis]|uniref:RNA polymerase sigma-70 factor (ECF subfamily) n=1 Tax=Catenuloplanes nepalensis TaxID=587533 RepID=A0ABT9N6X0_9ACTN|nr:sigma-70 family RNA polymerase sigma factor [Catenuloplanes nepalensis]MDP9799442.1 RNA polymerase sigma-70 factor (ECF subfamily) [Catenuloplanes nepalensis]
MDEEQFSAFFAAQFPDVWRFARRRTESGSDADDIAAETFAVAWRRRDDIPAQDARLWLFGVARNVLANHTRQDRRRDRLHLRLVSTDPPPSAYEQNAPSQEALWPALAALDTHDRELLLLRAWDGLGIGEIAALLGIDRATVSSRLHRARLKLDRLLQTRLGRAPAAGDASTTGDASARGDASATDERRRYA